VKSAFGSHRQGKLLPSSMTTLNWENENRRLRLSKWIAQNDLSPKWWEKDLVQQANLEAWAKRQSAEIVKRINRNAKEAAFKSTLDLLNEAIQANDENAMKLYAQKTLNENSIRNGASKEELTNLTLLVQMVLCIAD
jgi:hypothetical protein